MRRFVIACVAMLCLTGLALAETIRGSITAVADKEITVRTFGKDKKSEEAKYTISDKTEYLKGAGKGKDAEKATMADLKKAIEASGKGAFASIEVDGKNATKITFFSFGGKKKKDAE